MSGMRNKQNSVSQAKYALLIGVGITASLTATTKCWALELNDKFIDLAQQASAYSRAQSAYQQIQADPGIKSVLADKNNNSLMMTQTLTGPAKIETTKFQHYYKGVEVVGSMAFHHLGQKGTSIRNKLAQFDLSTTPTLSAEQAVSLAKGLAGDLPLKEQPTLRILPSSDQSSAHLVYWIELKGKGLDGSKDILIDAQSGQLIANLSHDYTIAPVQIYSAQDQGIKVSPKMEKDESGQPNLVNCKVEDIKTHSTSVLQPQSCMAVYQGGSELAKGHCQVVDGMQGFPLEIEVQSCDQMVSNGRVLRNADAAGRRAAANSSRVLTFYKTHFGRDSYDNRGSQVISVIHGGDKMDNAFWNTDTKMMVYGDGDQTQFGDFTLGADVAGHEMTHGITSDTAKLLMMGESGALNEAFSDFFGKLIEGRDDWTMGTALYLQQGPDAGIRDLSNPNRLKSKIRDARGRVVERPYPAKKIEAAVMGPGQACDGTNDRCWVHYNSTIPSHASYLVYQALGGEKAELLYYTALTQNLSASDDFKSSTQAILNTCSQLNFDSSDCDTVQQIYTDIGLI
jgi:Zn-dependent metalloprotease